MRDHCSHIILVLFAILLTVFLSVSLPAVGGEESGRFHALCVGLTYPGSRKPLPYGAKDAKDMAEALRHASGVDEHLRNVELLVDDTNDLTASLTPNLIRRRLRAMADAASENDRLMFFFAGHGLLVDQEYTALAVSDYGDTATPEDRLRLSDVKDILSGSRARRTLVIIDACRSGTNAQVNHGVVAQDMASPDKGHPEDGVAWLLSCDVGEKSYENDERRNGLFTGYLLESLGSMAEMADSNRDGWLSVQEICTHVQYGIAAHIRERLINNDEKWSNCRQHPQMGLGAQKNAPGLMRFDIFTAKPPPEIELDCGDGVKMKFVRIAEGAFMMGSPEKESGRYKDEGYRQVKISKPYYMGVFPVTKEQYRAVTKKGYGKSEYDNHPVTWVNWIDVTTFCRYLSTRTGKNVRLPTEAEWEYACRAGTTTPFAFGETISANQANYHPGTAGARARTPIRTTPVDMFNPNAWGLYDMHGNVSEWCSDWYAPYPTEHATDPQGPTSSPGQGYGRVVRGGYFGMGIEGCRSASRGFAHISGMEKGSDTLGFRVIVE